MPDAEESGLLGIATEDEQGMLGTYIAVADGRFAPVYDVRPVESRDSALRPSLDRALSDHELTRFMALRSALRQPLRSCAPNYNTVVLRDPEAAGWLVYLLSSPTDPTRVPIGGHYRISISADGTEVTRVDTLFDSCPAPDVEIGERVGGAASIEVIRNFSDKALETDVFLNLLFGIDIDVTTPSGASSWMLRDGRIAAREVAPDPQ